MHDQLLHPPPGAAGHDSAGSAPPAAPTCPACGAALSGPYCASCGQNTRPRVRSVRALLGDAIEELFGVNATLPRTLRALVLSPGRLTNEYLNQRISPYVSPFRLYLAVSVVFFLIFSVRGRPAELTPADRAAVDSVMSVVRDSMAARVARGEAPTKRWGITIDPTREDWAEHAIVHLGNERLNRAVRARLLALGELSFDEAIQRSFRSFVENVPRVMFVLLPLHALLLLLLYVGSGRYYVEHMIFSLHTHAFAFLVFVPIVLLRGMPVVTGALFLWLLGYQWVALRRVYRQDRLLTTVKWAALGVTYSVVIGLGFAVAIVAALLMM